MAFASTFQSVTNLVIQHLQFIALLGSLDIKWPVEFRNFLDFMGIFNLNPQDLIGDQEIPVIDFRLLFILMSVMIPIFITLCILLLFEPLPVVLWFFITTLGVIFMAAGLLGRFLPSAGVGDDAAATAEMYLVVAAVLLGISLIAFLANRITEYLADSQLADEEKDEVARFEREHQYLSRFHRVRSFTHFSVAVLLIIAGVVLLGFVDFNLGFIENNLSSSMSGLVTIAAYISLVIGGMIFIYFVVNLFRCGREGVLQVKIFLKSNLLMILILLISASYVPTMTYCMNMFLCSKYDCPAGTMFNPHAFREPSSYDTSASRFCDPCIFLNPSCASVTPEERCPASSQLRNWGNPEVSCEDETVGYFFFAAALVLVVYLACIPFLYYNLIELLSTAVFHRVQYPDLDKEHPAHWKRALALVRPAAAALYEPFAIPYRHYSLVSLVHRVLVVTILVVIAPFSNAAIPIILVVHAVACIALLWKRPYLEPVEQGLAIGMSLCNVLNAVFAVVVWRQDGSTPSSATGIYIFLNVVLPIVLSLGMWVYISYRNKKVATEVGVGEPTKTDAELEATKSNLEDTMSKKEIIDANTTVCNVLNLETGKRMGRFFMIMGIFFFIAFGACVLGTLRQREPQFIIGTNRFNQDIRYTLNNFESWTNFTSSCCCLNSRNPSRHFNVTERWVCDDGNVVDRGRVSSDKDHDSLPVRGLCAEELSVPFCSIDVSGRRAGVRCPSSTRDALVPSVVSDKAFRYYW